MMKILALISIFAISLFAAGDAEFEATKRELNVAAIIMFFIFVGGTLAITYWAAKRTKSAADFYTAGGGISGFQNGMAIAGDYMSAASFLGLSGLVYLKGYDGIQDKQYEKEYEKVKDLIKKDKDTSEKEA